ncbi:ATP-dependent serine protease [Kordia sp. TARA_039_SRF]|nr:ATP-dependent serine protease [Kordia sp. TARA_039_SRF]
MTRLKRAYTVTDFERAEFEIMPFEGKFQESFGCPEMTGSWIIYAESFNGKTSFTLQLVKYLTQFGDVIYNTLEEGFRASFKKALREANMKEVKSKFKVLSKEPIADLRIRLKRKRSAKICVIDSVQYSDLRNKNDYKRLINEFPNKLFIFISHAVGKIPKGALAQAILFDADLKIYVEGFKAFPESRHGGGKPFIIWAQGALEYWGEL